MDLRFYPNDATLTADEFLALFGTLWRTKLDHALTQSALSETINITARHESQLVGCIRILTDGYLMATVTEIIIDPGYTSLGIAKRLLQLAAQISPTNLILAVQSADDRMMQELGWHRGPAAYFVRKDLP